jgi:hypothetical protein
VAVAYIITALINMAAEGSMMKLGNEGVWAEFGFRI